MKREKLVKNKHQDEKLYYLWFIGVKPEEQGKGFGTAFMLELMADRRTNSLEYPNRIFQDWTNENILID